VWIQMEKWELSLKDFEALRKEMPGNTDVARALSEVQVAMKNSKGRGLGTEEKQQQQRLGVEVNVCSNDQLREEISNHGIAVVQFNTRWSEGCRQMASVVEKLCKLNPTVNFLKVDIYLSTHLSFCFKESPNILMVSIGIHFFCRAVCANLSCHDLHINVLKCFKKLCC
jgi:thiol-disulfide isomerase/thioredoxin